MENHSEPKTLPGKAKVRCLLVLCLLIFFVIGFTIPSEAREVIDMAGRRVIIPDTIRRVCTDWPIAMYLVYAIDPTLLAAVNTPITDKQKEYVPPYVRKLPVVGGFFGQGQTANIEALLKVKPDIVVAEIWGDMAMNAKSEEVLKRFGIPVVYVKIDTTDDYPDAFLFLGKLLGREARVRALSDYGKAVFEEVGRTVQSIPANKRPRVYYGEGVSGLFTECHTSFHAELIELAGATNVHHCTNGMFKVRGKEPISMEQVLQYDPEVIFVAEPLFYQTVFKDSRWKNIKAVKTGRVYLTPKLLFDWFDRPPSFMRLLGLQWVMWRLYPEVYRKDMEKEARRFYRLFLGVDIPAEAMKKVIGQ